MADIFDNIKKVPLNLFAPPASQTDDSIALLWDKPESRDGLEGYRVYMNGKPLGDSSGTDFTAVGLESSSEYEFYVRSRLESGSMSPESNAVRISTRPKTVVLNITEFGAVGDGKTLNTAAIQKAVDACPAGGKVYIPRGIFLSGAIFLKGDMTLYIDDGGTLLGSGDTKDYPLMRYGFEGLESMCYASLINTKDTNGKKLENITIAGKGKIDAKGGALRKQELGENKGKPGRAICLRNVSNLYLNDITVRQSPAWCVHFIYCENVSVNNIKVHTKFDEQGNKYEGIINGDGIDPDSSRNVFIFATTVASQDDCIAIKSGRDAEGRDVGIPSENIRITGCRFCSGFGVAVGSEMSGGVRNVLVRDCVFEDVYSIASVKAPRGRGGVIENIVYEDNTLTNSNLEHSDCEWFRGAIYADNFYSHKTFDAAEAEAVNEGTPVIKNITFRNIKLDTHTGNAIYMMGLPESPLANIRLENVEAVGKYGFIAGNIRGLVLKNVSVEAREEG